MNTYISQQRALYTAYLHFPTHVGLGSGLHEMCLGVVVVDFEEIKKVKTENMILRYVHTLCCVGVLIVTECMLILDSVMLIILGNYICEHQVIALTCISYCVTLHVFNKLLK